MSIASILYKKPGEWITKFSKTNFMKGQLDKSISDPARFAAGMLVTSIVSKDAINCYLYTTQSLNNKKIPEEKRKFVAALDLMNGILMVGGQFLIGKIIDAKLTPKLISKFTGTIKDKATGTEKSVNPKAIFHTDNIRKVIENVAKDTKINLKDVNVEKLVQRIQKAGKTPLEKGFGIIIAALATTALTKRTIVPLISTPLAGWFKEKYMDKKPKPNKNATEVATKADVKPQPKAEKSETDYKLIKAA